MISYSSQSLDEVLRKIAELDNGPEIEDKGEFRVEMRGEYLIASFSVEVKYWAVYIGVYNRYSKTWYNGNWNDNFNVNDEIISRGYAKEITWINLETTLYSSRRQGEWLLKSRYPEWNRESLIAYALDMLE